MKKKYLSPDMELVKFTMVDFILKASNDPEDPIPDIGDDGDDAFGRAIG